MKSLFLSLALVALGFNATAGNEGPQADPGTPTLVVAEYRSLGGLFIPQNSPHTYQYQILTNRKAVVIAHMRRMNPPKVTILKTLSEAEMRQFLNLVKQVKPGALFDARPNEPRCEDAPSYFWSVNTPKGKIDIASKVDCKTMSRKNSTAADQKIVQILTDLEKLVQR